MSISHSHIIDRILFRSSVCDDFKMSNYLRRGSSNIIEAKKNIVGSEVL